MFTCKTMKKSLQKKKKKKHLNDMVTCVAFSKVFCDANLRCSLKGTNLTFTKSCSLAMGQSKPIKNTKDMPTCVALWKEINQHFQNVHMQLGEPNPWKTHKKTKNKKTCKLVLLFQGCFAKQTCIALTFSRELWKSHITKDDIFKPLLKDNLNKKTSWNPIHCDERQQTKT